MGNDRNQGSCRMYHTAVVPILGAPNVAPRCCGAGYGLGGDHNVLSIPSRDGPDLNMPSSVLLRFPVRAFDLLGR
jgi:hypothetical protein